MLHHQVALWCSQNETDRLGQRTDPKESISNFVTICTRTCQWTMLRVGWIYFSSRILLFMIHFNVIFLSHSLFFQDPSSHSLFQIKCLGYLIRQKTYKYIWWLECVIVHLWHSPAPKISICSFHSNVNFKPKRLGIPLWATHTIARETGNGETHKSTEWPGATVSISKWCTPCIRSSWLHPSSQSGGQHCQ